MSLCSDVDFINQFFVFVLVLLVKEVFIVVGLVFFRISLRNGFRVFLLSISVASGLLGDQKRLVGVRRHTQCLVSPFIQLFLLAVPVPLVDLALREAEARSQLTQVSAAGPVWFLLKLLLKDALLLVRKSLPPLF